MWAVLHFQVLRLFKFPTNLAIADSLVSNILLCGVCILISQVLRFYLPQKHRYSYLLGLCMILVIGWFFISRSILMWLLNSMEDYSQFFSLSVPVRLAISFLIIGSMSLVSVLWYTVQDQQEIEKRKRDAEQLAKEAELYKLRQQLQPHFLFNSLNSINALIGSAPQQARMMILQLSDFLRGTMKKEEQQWISLEEELDHLQLYLDIEKVRFGHRLSTFIKNETIGMKLPVMLLQPVVENAIKFGLYDTTDDIQINIAAVNENEQLMISVSNPFDLVSLSPQKGLGFGLSSIQRRLYLLFARKDLIKTETEGNLFITKIFIPQI